MIATEGQPILTAAMMRAAEDATIAAGTSVETLMDRAGRGIAAAAQRLAAGSDILIACGPGNNGGDSYVTARVLRDAGHTVRVAASAPPRSTAARAACAAWPGDVEALHDATPAPVLIDGVFGTGLSRPLDAYTDRSLGRLSAAARIVIAVDLPSGMDADSDGAPDWAAARPATLTLALGALKPAHVLSHAAGACGAVRLIDIGLTDRPADVMVARRPDLPEPDGDSHKYTRGMVAIVAGAMAGAARLAGIAALRSGAGYVALYGGSGQGGPDALVHRPYESEALADRRIGAILIGPGLGRDDQARCRLAELIAADTASLVIDGDALHLLDPDTLRDRHHPTILTPHAGEFAALFGASDGSPIDRARAAARRAQAIVVLKGATTVVTDGTTTHVHPDGNPWLSTAGTGDVLAGTIAGQLAHAGTPPLTAAGAGVWLHARAAMIAGRSFIADDLANALTPARAGA